jgi:hypothetical protein
MGNKITRRRPVIDERYTRPQGLYPHRDVDQRKLRRLILESKLAPCFPGAEEPATDLEECPICFLVRLGLDLHVLYLSAVYKKIKLTSIFHKDFYCHHKPSESF